VVVTGVETLLNSHTELRIAEPTDSLLYALDVIRESPIDLIVLDKAFGIRAVGEFFDRP
jgi:hypothetical protein